MLGNEWTAQGAVALEAQAVIVGEKYGVVSVFAIESTQDDAENEAEGPIPLGPGQRAFLPNLR